MAKTKQEILELDVAQEVANITESQFLQQISVCLYLSKYNFIRNITG